MSEVARQHVKTVTYQQSTCGSTHPNERVFCFRKTVGFNPANVENMVSS